MWAKASNQCETATLLVLWTVNGSKWKHRHHLCLSLMFCVAFGKKCLVCTSPMPTRALRQLNNVLLTAKWRHDSPNAVSMNCFAYTQTHRHTHIQTHTQTLDFRDKAGREAAHQLRDQNTKTHTHTHTHTHKRARCPAFGTTPSTAWPISNQTTMSMGGPFSLRSCWISCSKYVYFWDLRLVPHPVDTMPTLYTTTEGPWSADRDEAGPVDHDEAGPAGIVGGGGGAAIAQDNRLSHGGEIRQ